MTAADSLALRSTNLQKTFGAVKVTDNVSFDLPVGARMGLIGPNGAGKTTLINLLTGVLKPNNGSVHLLGINVTTTPPEARVKLGLVRTHQITTLLSESSPLENVALAISERDNVAWNMIHRSVIWKRCLDEAYGYLESLHLQTFSEKPVRELPYGVQRIVEVAVALSLKPRVLLLDEPAAGVPSSEMRRVEEVLSSLPMTIALIIIDHDLELVFRVAREVTVLHQGQILVSGSPNEIYENQDVRDVYLGRGAL